jgi:hypothetical protein
VADSTIQDFDLDVVGTHLPALEAEWCEQLRGALSGIGFGIIHETMIS